MGRRRSGVVPTGGRRRRTESARTGMPLVTAVPDELKFHGIEPPLQAPGFAIALDAAQPQGAGRIAGRVERRGDRRDGRPVIVEVCCHGLLAGCRASVRRAQGPAALVGVRRHAEQVHTRLARRDALFRAARDRLARGLPIGGPSRSSSPEGLPRALEGTFVAFRWRIEARRARRVGAQAGVAAVAVG